MHSTSQSHFGAPLVAQLHSSPLDASEQFALSDSATRRNAVKHAELTASIRGFDGAFSSRALLLDLPPFRGMPTY